MYITSPTKLKETKLAVHPYVATANLLGYLQTRHVTNVPQAQANPGANSTGATLRHSLRRTA